MDDESDDPRDVELSSLSAIFPEIQRVNSDDPYTIALDVPVNPSKNVLVFFPTPTEAPANAPAPHGVGRGGEPASGAPANPENVDSHELSHLPSIRLQIALGPGYPASDPPQTSISTSPPWLPADVVKRLEDDGPRLWEEMGRDIVGFTYIDHVQQSAESVFGLIDEAGGLVVDPEHKITILDHDIRAKRAAFEKGTFDCGVCLGMSALRWPLLDTRGARLTTSSRSEERLSMPPDVGLWTCLLHRVSTRLLQQCDQGR